MSVQTIGKEKLEELLNKYSSVQEKLTYTKEQIEASLLPNGEPVQNLRINKRYFTRDFDGHFCSYYLVERLTEDTLYLMPLWSTENGLYETGETNNDILYGFAFQLNDKIEEEIFEKFGKQLEEQCHEKRKDKTVPFDLADYWGLSYTLSTDINDPIVDEIHKLVVLSK